MRKNNILTIDLSKLSVVLKYQKKADVFKKLLIENPVIFGYEASQSPQ